MEIFGDQPSINWEIICAALGDKYHGMKFPLFVPQIGDLAMMKERIIKRIIIKCRLMLFGEII